MKFCHSLRIIHRIIVSILLLFLLHNSCNSSTFEQESTVRAYLINRTTEIIWGRHSNQQTLTSEAVPILFSILNNSTSIHQFALEVKDLPSQPVGVGLIEFKMNGEIVSAIAQYSVEQNDVHKLAEYVFKEIKSIDDFNKYGNTLRYIYSFCTNRSPYFDSELIWLLNAIHTLPNRQFIAEDIKSLLELRVMGAILLRGDINDYDAIKKHILYLAPNFKNQFEKWWGIKTTRSSNIQRLEINANDTSAMAILTRTIIDELMLPPNPESCWDVEGMKNALSAICRVDTKEAYGELVKFVHSLEEGLPAERFYAAVDIRYELEKHIVDELKRSRKEREAIQIIDCMKSYTHRGSKKPIR